MKNNERRRKAVMKMLTADGMLEVLNGRYDDLHKVNDTTVVFKINRNVCGCRIYGSFDNDDFPILEIYAHGFFYISDKLLERIGSVPSVYNRATRIRVYKVLHGLVNFDVIYGQIIDSSYTAETLKACVDAGLKATQKRFWAISSWVTHALGIKQSPDSLDG